MKTFGVKLLAQSLIQSGVIESNEVVGFSAEEIQDAMKSVGVEFPAAYKEFLSVMGHSLGKISRAEALFFTDVQAFIDLQDFPRELLEETPTPFELPRAAIVISQHDGYQFIYLCGSQGDDPPALMYVEGNTDPKLVSPSFSAHLKSVLSQYMPKTPPPWLSVADASTT